MVRRARAPRGQQQSIETTTFPAPSKGIDARAPAGQTPIDNCTYTFNLMPDEFGMVIRDGYQEWVIDIESTAGLGVTQLIPFDSAGVAADDRLFAVTNEGIWDVTAEDTAPTLKVAFGTTDATAGHGPAIHYTNQANANFMFYADSANGLYTYTQSTDTWAVTTGITGATVADVRFVVVHKLRMWLIEKESSSAWYLPIDAPSGLATEFVFGGKLPHGGELRGMYNWSVDGGFGVDDFLVVLSSAGDVLPYQGDDPSSADTWQLVGTYFIGRPPKGRSLAAEYAGDLYLLSTYGLIAMSDLLRGVNPKDVSQDSLAFKIAKLLRTAINLTSSSYGWEPVFLPSQGQLLISSPITVKGVYIQYVLNLANPGWGFWRGVEMLSITEWQGTVYFGDIDNRVHKMGTIVDGALLTPPVSGQNGSPIEFSVLSSTQRMGSPSINKIAQYVRPDFLAKTEPEYETKVLFDYSITEPLNTVGTPSDFPGVWDLSEWDAAVWGRSVPIGFDELQGASGIGRAMAIAMVGKAYGDTRFMSWDVMWTTGGPT